MNNEEGGDGGRLEAGSGTVKKENEKKGEERQERK